MKVFRQGSKLLKEQDPDNGLFIIVDGQVKIEIREIMMGTAGPGSLLGERLNLEGLQNGIYLYRISADEQIQTGKVIKK